MSTATMISQLKPNEANDRPWLNTQEAPQIILSAVSKQFGEVTAVESVSLKIYKGEMFALVGGSGCGKTTLLRMLAGFIEPSSGKIIIDGQDMTHVPPYARPVNMMFQSYALFPHMSVEKNIGYGIKREKITKQEYQDRVYQALEMVQLTHLADRKPHQLSGGQRQRVALARALIRRPKVLLLDEPLSALDKKLREQTQFELMSIQYKLGITFIFVTHDQEEAMVLSSRIAVLDKGNVIQVGTPAEIYEFPNSRFVAEFVGSTNLFEGLVVADMAHQVQVKINEAEIPIIADDVGRYMNGQMVWVNVRPEKIRLSKSPPPPKAGLNVIEGVVAELGYRGNHIVYGVKTKTGRMVMVYAQSVTRTEELPIYWEDHVYAAWDADGCIVLKE